MKFSDFSLKIKLAIVAAAVFAGMLVVVSMDLSSQNRQMHEDRMLLVQSIVEGVVTQLEQLQQQRAAGELTLEQAQQRGRALVSAYRYDGGNYLWISDHQSRVVMHPIKPELNGRSMADFKDQNGVYLYNEFTTVTERDGGGYVGYHWSRPGGEVPVPKLAYVQGMEAWGWIVGTGIYVDDMDEMFWSMLIKDAVVVTLVLGLITLLFVLLSRSTVAPIMRIEQAMRQVQEEGALSSRIELDQGDEIGRLVQLFNDHLDFLQQSISEVNGVLEEIARGRFERRVELDMKGEFLSLRNGVNQSADSVDFTMQELGKVMDALYQGDFSVRMDGRVEGAFRDKVEQAMVSIDDTVSGIVEVMEWMEKGKFKHRVEVPARGSLLNLKEKINLSMASLEGAITDILRVVSAQAKGDMTHNIETEYHGELRQLKESINAMSAKLKEVVIEVGGAASSVSNVAGQVSSGSQALSQRTQEQAHTLQETSASMEEMTAAVEQNTDSAQEASGVANEVRQQAENGAVVMRHAVESMKQITESSEKIADIISLIDGIAFQTNLLALNAAVEAARAGEQGRGFAVVAGEVRTLAQRSAEASKDIKLLIEDSVVKVNDGSRYVTEAGEVLEGMNRSIQQVSQRVSQIADASREQSTGINQVNGAMANLDQVTQENAAAVEETSAVSAQMDQLAQDLSRLMSFFKT